MFKLRPETIKAFEDARRSEYQRQLLKYYKAHIPKFTSGHDDGTLLKLIADCDQKARSHGLNTAEGVARFIGLAIIISPAFDQEPRVQAFLKMPDLDSDRKMQVLCELLTRRLRQVADSSETGV